MLTWAAVRFKVNVDFQFEKIKDARIDASRHVHVGEIGGGRHIGG